MTKNQKIKRLEETIEKMGDLLGFSISFPRYKDDTGRNINYHSWNPPVLGWEDLRMKALLKHLGIIAIEKIPDPYPAENKYQMTLYPKKKSTRTRKED